MLQIYYTYKNKIIEVDKKQPLLLPILGIITSYIQSNTFDVWDLLILIDITCGKVDLQNLEEILNLLSETGLIRLVEKGYLAFSNTYRSNIKYSDYRYILFKLYNK